MRGLLLAAAMSMAAMTGAAGAALADDEIRPPPSDGSVKAVCAEADGRLAEMKLERPQGPLVLIYKNTYCPPRLTVPAGSAVTFLNVDKRTSHSVWFKPAGKPESDRFFPEERWTETFPTPGTFPYICGPHETMTGVVTVTK